MNIKQELQNHLRKLNVSKENSSLLDRFYHNDGKSFVQNMALWEGACCAFPGALEQYTKASQNGQLGDLMSAKECMENIQYALVHAHITITNAYSMQASMMKEFIETVSKAAEILNGCINYIMNGWDK